MLFGRKHKEEPANRLLSSLSFDELLSQKLAIEDELARRSDAELAFLKEKLTLIARFKGVEIGKILQTQRKKREQKIRYVNPDDPTQTWTGIGKPKKWLQDKLDAGALLEDFAVA